MMRLSAIESTIDRLHTSLTGGRSDLSAKQIRAFLMLAKASLEGEPLTTEDLRRFLNLSSGVAHKTVKYFVQRQLIEQRACPLDGRAKELHLTEQGKKLASEFVPVTEMPTSAACSAA